MRFKDQKIHTKKAKLKARADLRKARLEERNQVWKSPTDEKVEVKVTSI